jgi:L-fuconolactonase
MRRTPVIDRRQFIAGALALPVAGSLVACENGNASVTPGGNDPSASTATGGGATPSGEQLLIDSHVHVWVTDPQYPFAQGAKVPEGVDASAETLIGLMAANGVSKTVLIQVIHYKWDNSYVLDVLKRHPDLFQAVARVDPNDPAAPDHVSEQTEQGFRGVRISPDATAEGEFISGPLMPPLWARCEELKVPMTVLAPATRLPEITKLIDQHPDLTVVIDHMADAPLAEPEQLKSLLALKRYPNVYTKISHLWSRRSTPTGTLSAWPRKSTTPSAPDG